MDILDQIVISHVPIQVMDVGVWKETASARRSYVTQKPDVLIVRIHKNESYFVEHKKFLNTMTGNGLFFFLLLSLIGDKLYVINNARLN